MEPLVKMACHVEGALYLTFLYITCENTKHESMKLYNAVHIVTFTKIP